MYSAPSCGGGTSLTNMMRLNALRRFHNCTYTLHCTYMKTRPPVNPIATTTNLVQKGQLSWPCLTSSAVRPIRTHSDHTTQVMAITWNDTEQRILRRSLLVMSNAFHYNKQQNCNILMTTKKSLLKCSNEGLRKLAPCTCTCMSDSCWQSDKFWCHSNCKDYSMKLTKMEDSQVVPITSDSWCYYM